MILVDVNVLVYAYRRDVRRHDDYRVWLEDVLNGDQDYGVSDLVLSAFLRVVTHPRIFNPPSDFASAFAFAQTIRSQPNAVSVSPGSRQWEIFGRLCEISDARGNLVPDAYLAALAIESGSEWITTDRDFSRFRGLRWRHPLGA